MIKVSAYSGYKVNERPLSFVLDGQNYIVKKILEQWYEEDGNYFRVMADDMHRYKLKWDRRSHSWFII